MVYFEKMHIQIVYIAWHISAVASCNPTFPLKSLTFLGITVLSTFWRTTIICVVYSNLEKCIWQKKKWIFYKFRWEISRQEHIKEPISLYGNEAAFYGTVKNWLNEFNCGRQSLKGEIREGPAKTAVVPENIDAVRALIMRDHHTVR